MKIHIIENDDLEEYEKLRNKPKLRLLTNDYKVAEEENKYTFNENYTNNFNDKIMRKILKDKVQASIYLNEWLKIKNGFEIKPEEIEEVTESYITKSWKNRETDIVYKDKKYEGVFYLIEHQTKVDYLMAKREYKNEIENHYELNSSSKDIRRIGNVTALVIYIENRKWKAKRNIEELKIRNPRLKEKTKDDYELISINNYTLEQLQSKVKENEKNIILKLALINKLGQMQNEEIMIKVMKNIKISSAQIDYVASYINERISKKCGKEFSKLMIKSIEEKLENKEDKNMLEAFVDRFLDIADEREKRGKAAGEKIGEKRGIAQVAINMLKEKCDKKIIKKCTGLSYEKIKELEKTLEHV